MSRYRYDWDSLPATERQPVDGPDAYALRQFAKKSSYRHGTGEKGVGFANALVRTLVSNYRGIVGELPLHDRCGNAGGRLPPIVN